MPNVRSRPTWMAGHQSASGRMECRQVARLGLIAAVFFGPVLATTGCARAYQAQGGGAQVPFCSGYLAYDRLSQPDPADRSAVLSYVQGVIRIIDRIDTSQKAGGRSVPPAIVSGLHQVRTSTADFGRSYASARTPGARAEAVSAFASDDAYAGADAAVGQFYGTACLFKSSANGA